MARRYSGEVRISVRWDDATDHWECRVSVNGEGSCNIRVGRAPADRQAVDSPMAHDTAAHAALSFASEDWRGLARHAASKADGSGWHIGRDAAHAWPVASNASGGAK